MKKLKSFLMAIMLLFTGSFLVACGEEKNIPVDYVNLNYVTYTMIVGSTFQLEAEVVPAEATDKTVKFRSNDTNVAIVLSDGTVRAVGVGQTQIFAASNDGKIEENCLVTVVAEGQKLEYPFNVQYNKLSSSLTWDEVSADINNYHASYEVEVTVDGQVNTYQTLLPSFAEIGEGKAIPTGKEVTIRVKAKGDNIYYTDSEYSPAYKFTIQSAPSEKPTILNNQIIVPAVEGVNLSQYDLIVQTNNGGVLGQITDAEKEKFGSPSEVIVSDKRYIGWTIPNDLLAGTYSYKVYVKGDESRNIFNSAYVESETTVTKLEAPTDLAINDNTVSWRAVRNASGYTITVETEDNSIIETIEVDATKNNYTFTTNQIVEFNKYGNYLVYLTTKGNGLTTLTSQQSADCATQKLATPVITAFSNYSESYYKLEWTSIANASSYSVYLNNVNIATDITGNSFEFNKSAFKVGTNTLQVMATATRQNFTNSDRSSAFTVTKLDVPTLYTVNGVPTWTSVSGVDTYDITISNDTVGYQNFELASTQTSYELGEDYPVGSYTISIVAKGNSTAVIDSNSSSSVVYNKMSIPTNVRISEDMLRWDAVSGASRYQIEITKLDDNQKFIITAEGTAYNVTNYLSNYGYGNYAFRIRSYGLASTQTTNTNSDYSSSINAFKLDSPTNLRIENGKVAWNAVDYTALGISSDLFRYRVKVGNTENTTDDLTFDTSSMAARTYFVQVKTVIKDEGKVSDELFLLSSDYSSQVSMTKLPMPTNVGLVNGALTWDMVTTSASGQFEEISNYTVLVRQANETKETTVNSNSCSRDFISDVLYGRVSASVYANGGQKYLNSATTSGVEYYKLQTPNLTVSNGALTWNFVRSSLNGVSTTITNYTINVQEEDAETKQGYSISGKNTWDMANLEGGKLYYVSIIANGNGASILDSVEGDVVQVYRLNAPLASSFTLNEAGDGLTWRAENADAAQFAYTYEALITRIEINGESISYNPINTGTVNSLQFPDEYTGGNYRVQVRTIAPVGQPVVSSEYSAPVEVSRLASPTGLAITDAVAGWNRVEGASGYQTIIQIGDQTLNFSQNGIDTTTFNINGESSVNEDYEALNNFVGSISIQVVATTPRPENGLVISSAPSSVVNIQRYNTPTILISENYEITWYMQNTTDDGKLLIFEPVDGGSPVKIKLSATDTTFDMSNEVEGIDGGRLNVYTPYYLSIQALGDGSLTLDSPVSERYYSKVVKLVSPDYKVVDGAVQSGNWHIEDGKLAWSAIPGASKYEVVANDEFGGNNTLTLTPASSESLITCLPTGLTQRVSFTIKSYGGASTVQIGNTPAETYQFISSATTVAVTVNKLPTPENLSIVNGEIVWDYASNNSNLTEFCVMYGAESERVTKETLTFKLSEKYIKSTNVSVRVYAVGTPDSSLMDYESCYLSSDTSSSIQVYIKNQPSSLTITDGVITWSDLDNHDDFEVMLTLEGGETLSFVTSQKSTTLPRSAVGDIAGKLITSLTVRHKGQTTTGSSGYVNSATATPITNIRKLPEISDNVSINSEGALSWDYTEDFSESMKLGIMLSVDGTVVSNSAITEKVYNLQTDSVGSEGYKIYEISGYIPGSATLNAEGSESYIRNDGFSLNAYKFAPVSSISLNNGLELTWDMVDRTIGSGDEAISNNKFLIEYYYKAYGEEEFGELQTLEVVDSKSIPMWDLGEYILYISVLSNDQTVLKSDRTQYTGTLTFNKFEAGNGSAENPFIISTTTESDTGVEQTTAYQKLSYIYAIPSCYFKLAEDIDLAAFSGYGENNPYNNMPIISVEHLSNYLTGGLDGAGHTISNFKVLSGGSQTAMFLGVQGNYRSGFNSTNCLSDSSRFMGRSGIICDLKVTISELNLMETSTGTYENGIAFITHYSKGGWLVDVSISPVQTGTFTKTTWSIGGNEIVYGGIVAYMTSFDDNSNEFLDARTINCSSAINVMLVRASKEEAVYMGGVIGTNTAGSVLGCSNTGVLTATQVGGIVHLNVNKEVTLSESETKTYWATVSGCVNSATLTGLPTSNFGYTGGIVADNGGYIVLCLNKGQVTVDNGTSHTSLPGYYDDVYAYIGGIAGRCSSTGQIFNSLSYGNVSVPSGRQVTAELVGGIVGDNAATDLSNIIRTYYDNNPTGTGQNWNSTGNLSIAGEPSKSTSFLKNTSNNVIGTLNTEISSSEMDSSAIYTMGTNPPMFTHTQNEYPELTWSFTNPVS